MWTRALLKENGKTAFQRHYWKCVLATLLLGVLTGGIGISFNYGKGFDTDYSGQYFSDPAAWSAFRYIIVFLPVIIVAAVVGLAIGIAIKSFLCNIIEIGGRRYYLENRERETSVAQIFDGFNNGYYMNSVKTLFFRDLYIFGWTLLFIIPGVIKSFEYSMMSYLLAENPTLTRERAFELSRQMMDGHKMEAFVLALSFIGWNFLNALTGGILGIFYVTPYMHATYAEFYSALKAEALQRGITNTVELPGVSQA